MHAFMQERAAMEPVISYNALGRQQGLCNPKTETKHDSYTAYEQLCCMERVVHGAQHVHTQLFFIGKVW